MEWPKEKREEALRILRSMYVNTEDSGGLDFDTPYEALIATMLSAQCTDVRVNIVTAELFKAYNTAEKMLTLSYDELLEKIRTCGLAPSKTKNILASSKILIDDYNGNVPDSMEALTQLPGVGRKTANVVLANAFGIPGIAVDTHVNRVSKRIGLADGNTVLKVEMKLREGIPEELWSKAHHWLIWHGRRVCKARKPACTECPLAGVCRYNEEQNSIQQQ